MTHRIGFRIFPSATCHSSQAVQALVSLPTSQISDVMQRSRTTGALRPFSLAGSRLCGPATTVRPTVGDHLMVQRALDLAEPGSVLVVDAGGCVDVAMVGEIMVRLATARGLAGVIIDGAIRDLDFISAQPLPVYARGVTPRGPARSGRGEINVAVQVGGMVVEPGDILCGDLDGLVSVPPGAFGYVEKEVALLQRREVEAIAAIGQGSLDRTWIDKALSDQGFAGD